MCETFLSLNLKWLETTISLPRAKYGSIWQREIINNLKGIIFGSTFVVRTTHLIRCRGERLCRSNELFGRPMIKTHLFSCNSPSQHNLGDRIRSIVFGFLAFLFSNLREQRTCAARNHHIDRTRPLQLNVAHFDSFFLFLHYFLLRFVLHFFTVYVSLAVAAFYSDFRSSSRRLTVTH